MYLETYDNFYFVRRGTTIFSTDSSGNLIFATGKELQFTGGLSDSNTIDFNSARAEIKYNGVDYSLDLVTSGKHINMYVGPSGSVRAMRIDATTGKILLQAGASIDEFSTDTTLAGNSDTAVPTEKATKTYVDTQVATKIGGKVLDQDNPDTSVANTTTQTTLYTFTVPGGTLISNQMIQIEALLEHLNNSGSTDTVGIGVYYGGSIFVNVERGGQSSSASPRAILLRARLYANGSSNSQIGGGFVSFRNT